VAAWVVIVAVLQAKREAGLVNPDRNAVSLCQPIGFTATALAVNLQRGL
jgi:hypothetical protein